MIVVESVKHNIRQTYTRLLHTGSLEGGELVESAVISILETTDDNGKTTG